VGLGLISLPSTAVQLLLGSAVDTPVAITVARVAGIAMLALGVACWLARADTRSPAARGLLSAMMIYNLGVCVLLMYAALGAGVSSLALWPVAISHAGLAAWCLVSLARSSSESR
jgi:hypothetical protein